jgi:hypothetical protein
MLAEDKLRSTSRGGVVLQINRHLANRVQFGPEITVAP